MDEGSLRLVTKLISFIAHLFPWLLSFGSIFQSAAQVTTPYTCAPGSTSAHCRQYPMLPNHEVSALRAFVDNLQIELSPFITRSYCVSKGTSDSADFIINCDCFYENNRTCHITEVIMENVGLKGDILGAVSVLTYLKTLNLASNELTGKIPESLGNLQSLTTLNLNRNFLNGTIPPSMGNLSSVTHLFLGLNNLTGQIPDELGNLSKLEYLRLDENQLSGSLPPALGKLSNLQYLWLAANNFTGKLPDYSQLTKMIKFGVIGNNLSGPIPKYITNWNYLTELNLLGNNFEGELPPEIFNMESLEYLWVSDLNNSGFSFPKSAKLTNIEVLILRNCSINGSIPTYIGDEWKNLRYIDLSFNSLSGGIPDSLKDLNLTKMILTWNMLNGTIPRWINEIVQFEGDLSYNNFTNVTFPGPRKIYLEPNRTTIYEMRDKHCHKGKSKYHSLFINCGGGDETTMEGNQYEQDNDTSNFFVSPNKNWAYSTSGSTFSQLNDSSDYVKNVTCGVSIPDSEAPLYEDARLSPQSLAYYGFCLHKGNYSVSLHFAEIVYANDEDYSSLAKRIFDVYIQGNRVLQDFNIKEKAGGANKKWVENFTIYVQDNLLEIHFLWAGKGSTFNPPEFNGPLISAISVTRAGGTKFSAWQIAVVVIGSLFVLILVLVISCGE